MLQSIIILDSKSELTGKQGVNNYLIEPLSDAKGKTKDISIAQIRQLVVWTNQTAFIDQPRFVIIRLASRLGLEAQQALLKTLEEPADDLTIIICPQQTTDLLTTIRSRCASFDLHQLTDQQLADWQLLRQTSTISSTKLLDINDWLNQDSWQQFNFLAEYSKAKKDPQQLINHWLNQTMHQPATVFQVKQAHALQQALLALQNYVSPRLVFIRLHSQLTTTPKPTPNIP